MDISHECLVTRDRNYLGGPNTIDQFNALVIQIRFFLKNKETKLMIPKKRKSFQRYVFYTHEAPRRFKFPFYNHGLLENNFFNWTMNYRHDSDILESYGFQVKKKSDHPDSKLHDYTLKKLPNGNSINWNLKKGAVFWVASHCLTDNYRELYVQKLKDYIGRY